MEKMDALKLEQKIKLKKLAKSKTPMQNRP